MIVDTTKQQDSKRGRNKTVEVIDSGSKEREKVSTISALIRYNDKMRLTNKHTANSESTHLSACRELAHRAA